MAKKTALQIINARVKTLQKKHPGTNRKVLQKKAGKEYRDGKLSGSIGAAKPVKKKAPKKRTVTKTVTTVSKTIGGYGQLKANRDLADEIGAWIHAKDKVKMYQQKFPGKKSADIKRQIAYWKKAVVVHKCNITNLKKLI